MSIAAAPARLLTIEEWHDRYGDYDGRCELVRGRTIMSPTEAFSNITAAKRLERLFDDALMPTWESYRNGSVLLRDDAIPTVRVPDLLLATAGLDGSRWLARAAEVVLVVEVVSPSSMEVDWVTKGAEYAAAGIPNYLIVDVRFDEGPRLWLFDRLQPGAAGAGEAGEPAQPGDAGGAGQPGEAGETTTYPSYAEPTGDGTSVTIRIPGCEPLTITAADLARELA